MTALKLTPNALADWKHLRRIEAANTSLSDIGEAVFKESQDKLIFAEGDSWFDKFTPLPLVGGNLLDHLKTPTQSTVLDCATIGHTAHQMARGHQLWRTEWMMNQFKFDAILLSAGGNDLKDVVADRAKQLTGGDIKTVMRRASTYRLDIDDVIQNIMVWIKAVRSSQNESTPIILHGYDRFQPRPAKAIALYGFGFGLGPWLHPYLKQIGFNDVEMRSLADAIVDELNAQLVALAGSFANVFVVNHLGLLTPGLPGSTGVSGHWMDEIHPTSEGFEKLARERWDVFLAQKLGYEVAAADTELATIPNDVSTALLGAPTGNTA